MYFLQDIRYPHILVGPFPSSDMAWKWEHEVAPHRVWRLLECTLVREWKDGK